MSKPKTSKKAVTPKKKPQLNPIPKPTLKEIKAEPVLSELKVKLPKPVPEKPKLPDYDINYDEGTLDDDHVVHRAFVVDETGKMILSIDGNLVSPGFGVNRGEAARDFIRRNNSIILNKIYERKQPWRKF